MSLPYQVSIVKAGLHLWEKCTHLCHLQRLESYSGGNTLPPHYLASLFACAEIIQDFQNYRIF